MEEISGRFQLLGRTYSFSTGSYHPIAWYQTQDGGQSFYTVLAHKGEPYFDPVMQTHLLDGLTYYVVGY